MMPFSVVSFHAHPDDEALFTGGTLAAAAAAGHRVTIVTATDGAAGLARSREGAGLAARRREELSAAAAALGVTDARWLGYADSGMDGTAGPETAAFARCDPLEAASRLAAILVEVQADVLTVYDPAGGYGHPDHVRVHEVGTRAARMAGTPVVLEATVDRRALVRLLTLVRWSGAGRLLRLDPTEWAPSRFRHAYSDHGRITHKIDVRPFAPAKRRALAAHATQAGADTGVRTLAVLCSLPGPLFSLILGREWFVEQGRRPGRRPQEDLFASLRGGRPLRSWP